MRRRKHQQDGLGEFNAVTDLITGILAMVIVLSAYVAVRWKTEEGEKNSLTADIRELDAIRKQLNEEKIKNRKLADELAKVAKIVDQSNAEQGRGEISLQRVIQRQHDFFNSFARNYGVMPRTNVSGFSIIEAGGFEVKAFHRLTEQRLFFGDRLLFETDRDSLHEKGREVMLKLLKTILAQRGDIQEIHIEGHADTNPGPGKYYNLDLASRRAITVYKLLCEGASDFTRNIPGIDPATILLSATSYGEFKPVPRRSGAMSFSPIDLAAMNSTDEKRTQNRRIEVVLIYRLN